MSETRWTKGPWRAGASEFYPGLDGPLTKRVYTESPPNEIDVSGDNCRANALLIAAAPELYEALKDVLRSARKDFPSGEWGEAEFEAAYGEALDALRKARGEA